MHNNSATFVQFVRYYFLIKKWCMDALLSILFLMLNTSFLCLLSISIFSLLVLFLYSVSPYLYRIQTVCLRYISLLYFPFTVVNLQITLHNGVFVAESVVMEVVTIVVTFNQVFRIQCNVPIIAIVFVQFLFVVDGSSFHYELPTEPTDVLITKYHELSNILPSFSVV